MNIHVRRNLPFVTVTLSNGGRTVVIPDVLLDTGSAGCVFKEEDVRQVGLLFDEATSFRTFRGIGGTERLWIQQVARIAVESLEVRNIKVGISVEDYGYGIRGILGMDFLLPARAVIDLDAMELRGSGT